MVKRILLISAGAAVLFGCIVQAAGCVSAAAGTHHTDGNTLSSSWESEKSPFEELSSADVQLNTENNTPSGSEITSAVVVVPPTTSKPSTKPTTAAPSTTVAPTTEHNIVVENDESNVNSQDNTAFSFSKVVIDKPNYNYYNKLTKDMGYKAIASKAELSAYCKELLNLSQGKKQVKYIITEKGLFDDMAANMDELRKIVTENKNYVNCDKRDRYLCDELGIDYQNCYSNGVATFMFKKIQDIENNACSNSVYAVYYYSYTTKEQNEVVNKKVAEAIKSFTGTEYDKVLAAQIYLRSNVNYVESKDYLQHTAYGALVNKEAVCEGYAKAYKLLMDAMGIPCDVVINEEHAWNVVCLEGKWYLVDVTNDDTSGNGMNFFLLGMDALTVDEQLSAIYGYSDKNNTDRRELAEYGYLVNNK